MRVSSETEEIYRRLKNLPYMVLTFDNPKSCVCDKKKLWSYDERSIKCLGSYEMLRTIYSYTELLEDGVCEHGNTPERKLGYDLV